MKNGIEKLKNVVIMTTAGLILNAAEVAAQTNKSSSEDITISQTHIETMSDQNMPNGFKREQVFGSISGKEKVIASLFYFEDGKTKAYFISNDKHPEAFTPNIDYEKVSDIVKDKGSELVIAFAGAYKSKSGGIEGIAIENGNSVGESKYSKSGFVYISSNGTLELFRVKDDFDNYDTLKADNIVAKARKEKGSLFQQIPAIWNGVVRLKDPDDKLKFEWRAICQTKDRKKMILNCTEKITLKDFLEFTNNLKDAMGQPLIHNLMLEDTGAYSYGVFKDKGRMNYKMVDEQYADNKSGYTNVVVIGK